MVHITTLTCEKCQTIVAGNVLEERREMKCPRTGCDAILRFDDLPVSAREIMLEDHEEYSINA